MQFCVKIHRVNPPLKLFFQTLGVFFCNGNSPQISLRISSLTLEKSRGIWNSPGINGNELPHQTQTTNKSGTVPADLQPFNVQDWQTTYWLTSIEMLWQDLNLAFYAWKPTKVSEDEQFCKEKGNMNSSALMFKIQRCPYTINSFNVPQTLYTSTLGSDVHG